MSILSFLLLVVSNLGIYSIFEKSGYKRGLLFRIGITALILFLEGFFPLFSKILNESGIPSFLAVILSCFFYSVIVNMCQYYVFSKTRTFFSFLLLSEICGILLSFLGSYLLPNIFPI